MQKKEQLKEADVGLTEYYNEDVKPITGKLKVYYYDYIVNEIDKYGELSYISQEETNHLIVSKRVEESKSTGISGEVKSGLREVMKPVIEYYEGLVDYMVNIDELRILKDLTYEFPCNTMNKAQLTSFQLFMKEHCSHFYANVQSTGSEQFVRISLSEEAKKVKYKKVQEEKPIVYLYFDMMKVNINTINAVNRLSRSSGISVKSFMYAGTKDRFAITTQKVCVQTNDPEKTKEQLIGMSDVTLGNFVEREEELKVGDLKGNRFYVALREFNAENGIETVKESTYLP
jgi:tRNA pseudouridine13 synthase